MERADAKSSALKLLIADDHWVVRQSLKQVARGLGDDVSVLEASSFDEAVSVLDQNPGISLLLVDLIMPGFNEFEGLRLIRSKFPEIPVVIISVHEDSEYVLRAIQHGVIGYIPKSANAQEINRALSRVLAGEVAFPRNILARTQAEPAAALARQPTLDFLGADLTRREAEIMVMLGEGTPVSEIAGTLEITRQTVRVHLGNAIKKIGLKSREAAIRFAIENAAALKAIDSRP